LHRNYEGVYMGGGGGWTGETPLCNVLGGKTAGFASGGGSVYIEGKKGFVT